MQAIRRLFGIENKKQTTAKVKELKANSASSSAKKKQPRMERKDMEYSGEIYKYLRRVERVFTTKGSYLTDREAFRKGDRQKAIEWMIDVHSTLELKRETLYTGVSLFDRYIELISPPSEMLGLLALTCIFVGYKYEEVAYLFKEVLALRSFQGQFHEIDEIYEYEMVLLTSLGWRLSYLGPISFVDVLAGEKECSEETYEYAQDLSETLLVSGYTTFKQSSLLGAAIYWIILRLDKKYIWNLELSAKSLYPEAQVIVAVKEIFEFLRVEKDRHYLSCNFTKSSYKLDHVISRLKQLESDRKVRLFLEQ